MKSKELTATLAYLQRAMADPRLEPANREKLRKGWKELERLKRAGKLDRSRVFRATSLISSTLLEILSRTEAPKNSEPSTAARLAR